MKRLALTPHSPFWSSSKLWDNFSFLSENKLHQSWEMVIDMFQCNIGTAETQVDKLVYTEKSNYYKDFFKVSYTLGIHQHIDQVGGWTTNNVSKDQLFFILLVYRPALLHSTFFVACSKSENLDLNLVLLFVECQM